MQNANAALVFEFAYRFINLGRSYFGKLDEEAVKNNFVCVVSLAASLLDRVTHPSVPCRLIYELLDGAAHCFARKVGFDRVQSAHAGIFPQRSSTLVTHKTPSRTRSRCTLQQKESSRNRRSCVVVALLSQLIRRTDCQYVHSGKRLQRSRFRQQVRHRGEEAMSSIERTRRLWMLSRR